MNGDTNHRAITVAADAGRGWTSHMEGRFRQTPTLLKPTANSYSCCIFRVPKSQVESNAKAYKPRVVSVGPYHHGEEQLMLIEQHKPRLFSAMLDRTRDYGAGLDHYFEAVASLETGIRDSYSEALDQETSVFIEMMVLDACFIVEMFRVFAQVIRPDANDPLFSMRWIFTSLTLDLLLIENQIPFIVLQTIYDLSSSPSEANTSLNEIALEFFNYALRLPAERLERHYQVSNVTHLLDLFRMGIIGHLDLEHPGWVDEESLQLIPSTKQLQLAGIKFEPRESDELISVVFDDGVLRIPPLTLDFFTSSFFLNCVAFEQSYRYCSSHITNYMILMRCLVRSALDAEFLSQRNIITNFLGTDEEVTRFFNDLAKDVMFDMKKSYLAELFEQVNRYHQNKWHVQRTGIKREYFGSPWSFISAAAAFILLVLTFVQAIYAIYAYYRPDD
ncbi:UPF0481 protein At3g47200-like [Rhodamnia argentea]|uniref:UPF0481 protein At3g47200-like n=1 Tax=Rhodamnia argentea TaxID=178133 RepID=A0A8B8Q465_9MYRT|nr:UPF0481 protein At3g47200-like [Rhodamnia argentea]